MSSTWLAVSGLMVSSTGSALLRKVLFQLKGVGLDGSMHPWEKPWFSTFESVAACWLCLLIFHGHKAWKGRGAKQPVPAQESPPEQQPLLGDAEENFENPFASEAKEGQSPGLGGAPKEQVHVASWREIRILGWPGAFSVISIMVQGLGLQYISASLSMMLSGSCIVFTAVLSVVILRCRLNKLHFTGIALSLVGIGVVSSANLIWPPGRNTDNANSNLWGQMLQGSHTESGGGAAETALGIVLTLLAMLILAGRLVAEELALTGTALHPLQVLGYEGMWGTVGIAVLGLPLAWALPGNDVGHCQENPIDSVIMLWKNPGLNIVNVVFFLSVVGLNVFGLMVTQSLGSVFRAVLLTARTASVWAVDLVLYEMRVGGGAVGEPWINPASWIQLFGFALLLLGTIMYAQGSSQVAQFAESKSDEDMEGAESPYRVQPRTSAVTRLRPYTSLYIPQGPRYDRHAEPLRRASHSLPREGPPVDRPGHLFASQSYTPGMLLASGGSGGSGNLDRLLGGSPNRSLFVQTLTHPSSWVLNRFQEPAWARRDAEGIQEGDEEAEDADGGESQVAEADEASTSGWQGELSRSLQQIPFAAESTASLHLPPPEPPLRASARKPLSQLPQLSEDGEAEAGPNRAGDPAQPSQVPAATSGPISNKHTSVMGQSPAPELVLQSRASARKQRTQMPSLAEASESDAAAGRAEDSSTLTADSDSREAAAAPAMGQSPAPELVLQSRASARKPLSRLPSLSESVEEQGSLPSQAAQNTASQSSSLESSHQSATSSLQPASQNPRGDKSFRRPSASPRESPAAPAAGGESNSGRGSGGSASNAQKSLLQKGLSTEKSLGRPLSLRTRASSGSSALGSQGSTPLSSSSASLAPAKKPYPGADALHKAKWWQSQSEPWDGGTEDTGLHDSGSSSQDLASFPGGVTRSPLDALQQPVPQQGSSAEPSPQSASGQSAEQGQGPGFDSAESSGSEGRRRATAPKEAEEIAVKTGVGARGRVSQKFVGQSPTPAVLDQEQAHDAASKTRTALTPFAEEDAGWNSDSDQASSLASAAAAAELTTSRSALISIPSAEIPEHGRSSHGQGRPGESSGQQQPARNAPMGQSPTPELVLARRASARSAHSKALPSLSEEGEDFAESVGSRNGHSSSAGKGAAADNSDVGSSSSGRTRMGQSPTPAKLLKLRATSESALQPLPAFQEAPEGSQAASSGSDVSELAGPGESAAFQGPYSETSRGGEGVDGDWYPASDSDSEGGRRRRARGSDSEHESDAEWGAAQDGESDGGSQESGGGHAGREEANTRRASTGARKEEERLPRNRASNASLQSWGGDAMSL